MANLWRRLAFLCCLLAPSAFSWTLRVTVQSLTNELGKKYSNNNNDPCDADKSSCDISFTIGFASMLFVRPFVFFFGSSKLTIVGDREHIQLQNQVVYSYLPPQASPVYYNVNTFTPNWVAVWTVNTPVPDAFNLRIDAFDQDPGGSELVNWAAIAFYSTGVSGPTTRSTNSSLLLCVLIIYYIIIITTTVN